MKLESYLLRPEPGLVVEIFIRRGQMEFHFGFCREVLHMGEYLAFIRSFRRASNVGLTGFWPELHDFGVQRNCQFTFACVP